MHPSEAEPTPASFIGRVARSGAWNVVAYVVDAGSALGISVLVGRALGPATFGRYAYLMWIIRTVAVLGAIGLPAAATRMVSEFLGADDAPRATGLYRTALRIHLVTTPLLFLIAGSFVWIKGGHDPVLAIAMGLATVFLS
ncbi:MAG TPA: oligosaccharide flippase family protein, partial [Actinomycetota bacterium]|nr:oligosaccharide flippase family protein [Actinomycetota bacterium]